MRRRLLLSLPGSLLAASPQQDVLAALERWRSATLAADTKTLLWLMHPDLWFSHSDARLESRDEFIAALSSGQLRYERIDLGPQKAASSSLAAWTRGDMTATVVRPSGANTYNLNVLHVWIFADGRWQLAARQSTRRLNL
ncbi:MAG: nuclear transport factor 2 family protein [Acidobacteriota bacterium]|jgi:hypothetical protein